MKVLSKGLSFCPTPNKDNTFELQSDIQEFKRRCRLAYIYRDQDTPHVDENPSPFPRVKSSYQPPPCPNPNLERYLTMVEGDILNTQNWNTSFSNLSKDESTVLQQLKNMDDVIIIPADKGGSIVVMDTSWYISECENQLQDTQFYKALDSDPTENYTSNLQKKINRWKRKGWVTNELAQKLLPGEPKPGHFYGLPKVHKKDTPLRPIIPQCQALSTPLSSYVDFILQPIVKSLPSYIKDTNHHLQDLNQIHVPDGAILVTMDSKALHTTNLFPTNSVLTRFILIS